MIRACLDADVLIPIESCDLLLTAAELGIYEAVTSPMVPAEIERNLVTNWPHLDPAALRRRADQVAAFLRPVPASATPAQRRRAWVNEKDRHLLAAALYHRAQAVVTNDQRLRNQINVRPHRIIAVSGDQFAHALQRTDPAGMAAVVTAMAARRRRPPIDTPDLVERLRIPFPSMVQDIGAGEPGDAQDREILTELTAMAGRTAGRRTGPCPGIVARTGEPCALRAGHRGSCRSAPGRP